MSNPNDPTGQNKKIKVKNKKPIRYYMTTFVTVCALALLQIIIFVVGLSVLSEVYFYIEIACWCISLFVVYLIINRKVSASYKLAWCVPILLFPVFGGLAYVIARSRQAHKKFLKKAENAKNTVKKEMPAFQSDCSLSMKVCPRLSRYLAKKDHPGYDGTEITYFGSGEEMYNSMMEKLKGAKHFIFMEFFIIREGGMWQSILKVLRQKVKEGVDVRILYDGMGSVKCLPMGYDKKLRTEGINARVFHPFVPLISTMQNNRDHKKIVVVDGECAYTGGINISDEYIGLFDRCGKWKDSGILLTGKGAAGLTKIFLEMWYLDNPADKDIRRFFPPGFRRRTFFRRGKHAA